MADAPSARNFESNAPSAMGKYVPFARLGHGGAADVFLAVAVGPAGFNKLAVVKRLRHADDGHQIQMFLDEARLTARLSHPNIVNTYEVGDAHGKFYIAMEYLEGQPLQALTAWFWQRQCGISEALAAFIAVQTLKGLHYAHELADYDGTPLGVVHRDVSPHNLFVTYGGEVKLLDFGIAKASMNVTHTETGVLKGKVRYMAPEQATERDVDRRVDIFAFGIVLWEMLGRRPLHQGDTISILTRVATEDAPSVRTVRPEVSAELEAIVAKALRRDRSERYATADAMRLDLERFLRGKQEGALDAELGGVMNEAFTETRDNVRARIRAFIAALPARDADRSSVPGMAQAGDQLPSLFGEGSNPKVLAPGTTGASITAGAVASPTLLPHPAGRSRWMLAAAGAVLVAGLGAFALWPKAAPRPAPTGTVTLTAAPPTKASVRFQTTPAGALVEWNGKVLGRAPTDFALEPGPQALVVSLDGYETEQVTLDVTSGAAIDRAITLRPKTARAVAPLQAPSPPSPPRPKGARPHVDPTPTASPSAPRPKIRVLDDSEP